MCLPEDLIKADWKKTIEHRNKKLIINGNFYNNEPKILFKDEIMYALGNIIQNAITYGKNKVQVQVDYTKNETLIKIVDDGNGFSKDILDKLGEPYISKNNRYGLGNIYF